MNVKTPLLVLGVSSVLFPLGAAPSGAEFSQEIPRSSVLVMEAEVTVDGEPRPNLGRSFTDSICGGLLKNRNFRVIDHLSNEQIAEENPEPGVPPERNAVRFGRLTNADTVFIPRMVIEDFHHVMTVKKVHISTGELLNVYQASAEGSEPALMFELCEACLNDIVSDSTRMHTRQISDARRRAKGPSNRPSVIDLTDFEPPAPAVDDREESEPEIKDAIPVEPETGGKVVVEDKDKEKKTAPAGLEGENAARLAGRVSNVNASWGFCVFTVNAKAKVKIGDRLFVTVSDPLIGIAKLDVVKLEGHQAIADFSEDIDTGLVRSGAKVYFRE